MPRDTARAPLGCGSRPWPDLNPGFMKHAVACCGSGRRRDYSRRPPTPHGRTVRYPAVPVYWAGANLRQRVWFRALCRLALLWAPRSPSGLPAPISLVGFRVTTELLPHRSESTRDYPLMTGAVLHRSGFSRDYDLCCHLSAHPNTIRRRVAPGRRTDFPG